MTDAEKSIDEIKIKEDVKATLKTHSWEHKFTRGYHTGETHNHQCKDCNAELEVAYVGSKPYSINISPEYKECQK